MLNFSIHIAYKLLAVGIINVSETNNVAPNMICAFVQFCPLTLINSRNTFVPVRADTSHCIGLRQMAFRFLLLLEFQRKWHCLSSSAALQWSRDYSLYTANGSLSLITSRLLRYERLFNFLRVLISSCSFKWFRHW